MSLEKYVHIEHTTTCTVSFMLPSIEKIDKAIEYACYNSNGTCGTVCGGGPCYWPYVEFSGDDEAKVKAAAINFVRYLKKFKGVEIEERNKESSDE